MKQKFGIKDILMFFAFAGLLMLVFRFALSYISYFANMEEQDVSGINFAILYLFQTVVLALPLGIIIFFKKNFGMKDLGFGKIYPKNILKFAFLGYVYYIAIMIIISLVSAYTKVEVPGFEAQESHISLMGDGSFGAVVTVVIITFFAPVLEEVIFRGFIFKTMIKAWPEWVAFAVSGLVFATIHMEFQSILPLFILGMILNWMFFRTKSIYPGIFFHVVNNGIALGAEYYLSAQGRSEFLALSGKLFRIGETHFPHPEIMQNIQGFISFIF